MNRRWTNSTAGERTKKRVDAPERRKENKRSKIFACLFSCAFLSVCSLQTYAQDTLRTGKVITNAQMVGIGSINQLDTYLSPGEYRGSELRYVSHSVRENGSKISRELIHQAQLSLTRNRAENNREIGGLYNFQYNVQYELGEWQLGNGRLMLKAGGGVDANIGFLYNTRNGNNPAQAYVNLNLAPNATAAYRFRLWNRPFQIRYEMQLPLVGLMYAPNFGQSYYEIFSKGDYDHNIVPTTIGSAPSLRQMLTFDFSISHTTVRLGYLGDFQQAKVNGLKYHTWSNLFVVGIVRKFSITKILP